MAGTETTTALMPGYIPIEQRFWAKVDRRGPDECWPWLGGTSRGYGVLSKGGKYGLKVRAHRFAYELVHGPIPCGTAVVMHLCDERGCTNPAHLRLGTQNDNVQDMVAKGRDRKNSPKGERHGLAKLTADDVREIRAAVAAGSSKHGLARRFGVRKANIQFIVTGHTWKHLL